MTQAFLFAICALCLALAASLAALVRAIDQRDEAREMCALLMSRKLKRKGTK